MLGQQRKQKLYSLESHSVLTKDLTMCRLLGIFIIFVTASLPLYAQIDRVRGGPTLQSDFSSRYALISANTENLRWVRDPAGSERSVLQIRTRDTDQQTYGAIRSEISLNNDYTREGVRWYAISMYFPVDWQPHPYPVVVGQIHTSQKNIILSPPVAFVVHDQNINLELYANHRPLEGLVVATRSNSAFQLIRLDRMKTEQWYCFVVRADWSSQPGQGSLKIWMNGDKVYEATNLYNSYESWLGNYPRSGLYMPGMTGIKERMLYLDFLHVGGERTGFEEMSAQTPCDNTSRVKVKR